MVDTKVDAIFSVNLSSCNFVYRTTSLGTVNAHTIILLGAFFMSIQSLTDIGE